MKKPVDPQPLVDSSKAVLFVRKQDIEWAHAQQSEVSIGARFAPLMEYTTPLYLEGSASVYVVQAEVFGNIVGQVAFPTAAEACAFRDECKAFEETRYTVEQANAADPDGSTELPGYTALRQDFNHRHPWKRFSRGVRFIARTQPIGRPVKVQS